MSEHEPMSASPPPFYFGAMSPYSWLAAERIEGLLPQARWRGVLAGVVFAAHGRTSWGLTERRAEGLADCEARAEAYGLGPIRWPARWPTSDLLIARGMLVAERRGLLHAFALAGMRMAFRDGADLAERDVVLEAGRRALLDAAELEEGLADVAIKQQLRNLNDEALAAGVFGVPTVIVGGQLFWGDDRLDDAATAYARRADA
jgi:2-hydroxychromene-2-carboxylate isomerase